MNYNKINKVVFLEYLIVCNAVSFIITSIYSFWGIEEEALTVSYFTIIYAITLAPIIEEVLFRKLLLKLFMFCGERKAIVISAFLFGLWHFDIVQSVYAFFGGIILGIVAVKYGTIKYTILLHAAYNALEINIVFLNYYVWLIIEIAICILALIIIKRDHKELFLIAK